MNDALDDVELYGFLRHLKECPVCADELEINYIVHRGIEILDEDRSDYNLQKAYRSDIEKHVSYLARKRILMYVEYVIGTVSFWALLTVTILYVRLLFTGG